MGQLIAGGLLVLGIIFLVAVVFLVRSEPDTQESSAGVPQTASPTPEPDAEESETADASNESVFAAPTVNKVVEGSEWHPLAGGQLSELLDELRSMRNQAHELEHRLSTLIDVVQRVDQVQNGRFPIEEDEAVVS